MPNKGGEEVFFFEKKNEVKSLSDQVTRVCSLATIFVATYHLTKLKKTGSVARKEGSGGRPRSARMDANIEQGNELICSQDEDWGTHQTSNEIVHELEIDRSSVRRIIEDDLQLRPLKKLKVQKPSDFDIERRFDRKKDAQNFQFKGT